MNDRNQLDYTSLDQIAEASLAVRGLSELLVNYVYQNEDSPRHLIDGVHSLFDMLADRIEHCEKTVRSEYRILAKLVGASNAPAVDVEQAADLGQSNSIREPRQKFVAEKLAEGVDLGEIAQTLNMKRTAVEKLADQLTGSDAPDTKVAAGKAVNG